jgi:hypothetical protein
MMNLEISNPRYDFSRKFPSKPEVEKIYLTPAALEFA